MITTLPLKTPVYALWNRDTERFVTEYATRRPEVYTSVREAKRMAALMGPHIGIERVVALGVDD